MTFGCLLAVPGGGCEFLPPPFRFPFPLSFPWKAFHSSVPPSCFAIITQSESLNWGARPWQRGDVKALPPTLLTEIRIRKSWGRSAHLEQHRPVETCFYRTFTLRMCIARLLSRCMWAVATIVQQYIMISFVS